jgi:hypothetical protein
MGMASTAGLNALAHSVTFGINLAVFTNLCQYMYTRGRRGPFYCVLTATVLVMADLVRHLINDANNWLLVSPLDGTRARFNLGDCRYVVRSVEGVTDQCDSAGSGPFEVAEENALGIEISMYNPDGSLSVYGWFFTVFCTWTGFALLFAGIFWYANLWTKMRIRFNNLRGRTVDNGSVTEELIAEEGA